MTRQVQLSQPSLRWLRNLPSNTSVRNRRFNQRSLRGNLGRPSVRCAYSSRLAGIGETIELVRSMRHRIAMWASAGFLVAGYWAVYAFATMPTMLFAKPEIMILVRLTCPIMLLSHYSLSLYLVLVANAATYALVGLIVEILRRRQLRHAN